MVQRVPVASVQQRAEARARGPRRLRLRPQLDHRRGEADQVDRVDQMRVQHRLALLRDQGGDIAEARQARRRRSGAAHGHRRRRRRPRAPPPPDGAGAGGGRSPCAAPLRSAAAPDRRAAAGRTTWQSRISTISAAARRSGAVSTSPTPFSSICQARASTGTDSRSASAAPRVRSASGSSWLSRSAGTDFSRVTRVDQLQQVLQHHAEIGAALVRPVGDLQRLARLAGHHRLQQVEHQRRGRPGPACRRPPPR